MEFSDKSRYVARIISGEIRVKLGNRIFFVRIPSKTDRYLAEEIYREQLEEAGFMNAMSDDDILNFLLTRGIWTEKDEETLKVLTADIEKFKIGLYELRLKSSQKNTTRKALQIAKHEFNRLQILRHSYDHMGCVGIASSAKERYLLGCSIFNQDGSSYWEDREVGWCSSDPFLDKILLKLNTQRLDEPQYRELARTEPWRSTWNIQKYCTQGVFSCAATDLTEDQRNLIIWSSIYESIRDHPDNLSEDIIEDDDMVDGWMIIKRKEKEKNNLVVSADNITKNSKIKNASELFIPADTLQDAQKIINMNDEEGAYKVNKRMEVIRAAGSAGVAEQKLPDVANKLRQQQMDSFRQRIKQT